MNDISIDQTDFTKTVEGAEDIKQCWKNILFTIPGSVPLMPTFGCDLWQYIDKPNSDSFGKVRNVIIAALEKWEPRTKINKCTRTVSGEQSLVDVIGTYQGQQIASKFNISPSGANYTYISTPSSPIVDIGGMGISSTVKDVFEMQYTSTGGESFITIPEGSVIVQIIREFRPMKPIEYTSNDLRINFNNSLNEGELISVLLKTI